MKDHDERPREKRLPEGARALLRAECAYVARRPRPIRSKAAPRGPATDKPEAEEGLR